MLGASVFWAQEFELSFTNELSSGVVTIDKIWDDETNFAGIVEKPTVEFSSEKVDAYLKLEFTFGTGKGNETSETDHLNFAWTDLDYWLRFRPFKIITLAFHDDLWMSGSRKNIFNASLEWVLNDFAIAAEIVSDADFDDEDSIYDMYIGVKAAYTFAENFVAGLGGQCFLDFGETDAKPVFGIEPSLGCAFGNHEFSLAADFEFCDGNLFVKFPISWIYSF